MSVIFLWQNSWTDYHEFENRHKRALDNDIGPDFPKNLTRKGLNRGELCGTKNLWPNSTQAKPWAWTSFLCFNWFGKKLCASLEFNLSHSMWQTTCMQQSALDVVFYKFCSHFETSCLNICWANSTMIIAPL